MKSDIEVRYVDHMGTDLTVVNSARVSFGKKKTVLDAKDIKLIGYLAEHDHLTPFEHCTLSIQIKCPLYIRSQIHRHRTFAYNELSRRYTDENIEFFNTKTYRLQHKTSKQCSAEDLDESVNEIAVGLVEKLEEKCLETYHLLLDMGVSREQARGVLPQTLMTEFYMTGNLRNWAHFLKLRLDTHAQKEVRDISLQIRNIIESHFPNALKALEA